MTNKRGFITARKAQYAVSTFCRLLKMSRGWFYGFVAGQPARDQRFFERKARDEELLPKIKVFFKTSKKCYGSKRIHPLPTAHAEHVREEDLLAANEAVSERRVARIMKENKVSPRLKKRKKPVTTDSNHKMSPPPNLLEQKFHCSTPNTVWLADITYIDTDEGWLYLAGIKDMATREIVGPLSVIVCNHLPVNGSDGGSHACCEALKMALGRRGPVPGLIPSFRSRPPKADSNGRRNGLVISHDRISSNAPAGVFHPRVLRGRLFSV
jgi:putative transposase